jgi:hypothetical protein
MGREWSQGGHEVERHGALEESVPAHVEPEVRAAEHDVSPKRRLGDVLDHVRLAGGNERLASGAEQVMARGPVAHPSAGRVALARGRTVDGVEAVPVLAHELERIGAVERERVARLRRDVDALDLPPRAGVANRAAALLAEQVEESELPRRGRYASAIAQGGPVALADRFVNGALPDYPASRRRDIVPCWGHYAARGFPIINSMSS